MNKCLVLFTLFFNIACNSIYEIAYISDQENNLDIYLTNSDFQEIINLTETKYNEYNLTWSPDGSRIYYTAYENSGRSIKYVDLEGGKIYTVLDDSTVLSLSDVGENNERLLISTNEHSEKGELYIYDVNSKSKERITNNNFYESGAKFTNDEKYIIASIQVKTGDSLNHSGIAEIFKLDLSTMESFQLTNLGGFSGLPDISPTDELISFHLCKGENCDIYVIDFEGNNLINITKGLDDNRWPRWSPDGKWIAFTKTIGSNSDIYFSSKNGKNFKSVISTEFRDEIAIFKPY